MTQFERGRQRTGGRQKGTRNRLSGVFLEALLKEFVSSGRRPSAFAVWNGLTNF